MFLQRYPIPGAGIVGLVLLLAAPAVRPATDLEQEPIRYSKAPAENAVTRLQQRLTAGQTKFSFSDDSGYLESLLKALDIPTSSQVLVFSKTSLQRDRIAPRTPRALYFNDEVYVGFCLRGEVLEVSAADAGLGTAFYTLEQDPSTPPRFTRQTDNCLICHGSSLNRGFPGHLVRSLYTDRQGQPILSAGSHRTDHASPFKERWGGWYVSGTHGRQEHMGNRIATRQEAERHTLSPEGQNVTDLRERFAVENYLTPHSDLVALMVLEHQAEMHNRLTRAALETRMALHYQQGINKALGEPADYRSDSTVRRIQSAGDAVLQYLLFHDEAPLTDPVRGTSSFQAEFAARGPRDARGRSLRDFDLTTRMFRYPCSYLIYSNSFNQLPIDVKDHVLRRLFAVLTGADTSPEFAHLSAGDRQAILEILRETKPDLPSWWQKATP